MIEDEPNGNIIQNVQVHVIPITIEGREVSSPNTSPQRLSSSSSPSNGRFTMPEHKRKHNDFENKKLNRGISRATDNVNIVSQARSSMLEDQEYFLETPIYTFALPDINTFDEEFKKFLVKDLIAISTQSSLEQANRLNWWTNYCQRLWPLSTSGDGNCLLHAASLGMWGFHDRLLTLRKTLHCYLTQSPRKEALWRRWRRQQHLLNAQAGLVYSEIEWRQEWNAIVNMASSEPRLRRLSVQSEPGSESTAGNIYESLEEIHVLALAHVLKRPIIVVADTVLKDMNGDDLAPIPFGGIYLPQECNPDECFRSPLLLAYDGGHFSALVSMDSPSSASPAIPLTDMLGDLLPIQFSIDPDPGNNGNNEGHFVELTHAQNVELLSTYLNLINIEPNLAPPQEEPKNGLLGSIGKSVGQKLKMKLLRSNSQRQSKPILCALLNLDKRHEYHEVMIKNYLDTARERFQLHLENNKAEYSTAEGGLRYNAGKSKFYTEVDQEAHDKVSQLTPVKPPSNDDMTLYLSNSTFYETSQLCRTNDCNFFGNPQTDYYCSKCYSDLYKNKC
ncbi:OTU domain-containing protein 7B-like isoform X2 [Cimex lectularius]|uniref:ubiquitinyl hydrolase 1 n=1 Tax=Cimex lectularius TaxID=79782 RepID=A0A8I6TCR9_CIMLE|nr:OTU domain-containing protein 7B-like isoform X2 [Cimex lectularius]